VQGVSKVLITHGHSVMSIFVESGHHPLDVVYLTLRRMSVGRGNGEWKATVLRRLFTITRGLAW
jgi:hypothetical protein